MGNGSGEQRRSIRKPVFVCDLVTDSLGERKGTRIKTQLRYSWGARERGFQELLGSQFAKQGVCISNWGDESPVSEMALQNSYAGERAEPTSNRFPRRRVAERGSGGDA